MKKFLIVFFLIILFGSIIGGCWWFLVSGANMIQEKLLAGLSENQTSLSSDKMLTNDSGYSAIGVDSNRAKGYFTPGAAASKKDLEKLYLQCSKVLDGTKYDYEPTIYADLVVQSPDKKKMVIYGIISFDDAEISSLKFEWYTKETIFRAYPGGAYYPGKDQYFLNVKDLSVSNLSKLSLKVKDSTENKEYYYDCSYALATEENPDQNSNAAIYNICQHLYMDLFYVTQLEAPSEDPNTLFKLDSGFLYEIVHNNLPLENNPSVEKSVNNIYKNYYDVKYEDEGANDILGYMAIRYTFYSASTASRKNYYILLHATDAVPGNNTMMVGVYDEEFNCLYYTDSTGLQYADEDISIKLGGYELEVSDMVFVKNIKDFGKYKGFYESTKFEPFGEFDLAEDFYYGVNHNSKVDLFYKEEK